MEGHKAPEENADKLLPEKYSCRLDEHEHVKSERCEKSMKSSIASPKCDVEGMKYKYKSKQKGPWVTSEFLAMVIQRDMLYTRLQCNIQDAAIRKEFTICRNKTAALRRKLKRAYQTYLEEM